MDLAGSEEVLNLMSKAKRFDVFKKMSTKRQSNLVDEVEQHLFRAKELEDSFF